MPGDVTSNQPIHCPLYTAPPLVPCDLVELTPLLAYLRSERLEPQTFPRGTLTDDGRLDLCKQALGPVGCMRVADALAQNRTVVSLLLGTDGIGPDGVASIATLIQTNPHIEILYLGCNRLDAAAVVPLTSALAHNSSITGLWLKRNPLGPAGAVHLAKMLLTNSTLQTLDLVNTRLGHDGLAVLTDALTRHNKTVERLYLGGNFFGPDEASLLADLVCSAPHLKALLLNVGFLGDSGAALLASALPESSLEELGLASNGIGPDGAAALFDAAASHQTLTRLDLGYSVSTRVLGASANVLGDAGAAHAARSLSKNPSLRHLDLRGNSFTNIGVGQIADALEYNTNLCSLALDGPQNARLSECLTRNRAKAPELPAPCRDVLLTRSVYRTS